jgi:hypothetical protein
MDDPQRKTYRERALVVQDVEGEGAMGEQSWSDKLDIQALIYRYSDSINRNDIAATESVFAPNAIWESPVFGMYFSSAREFCDFLNLNGSGLELLIQTPHCPVVTIGTPNSAIATTTIYELSRGIVTQDGNPFGPVGTELNFEDFGIYYDTVARIDGTWLFTHRVFVPVYMAQGAATGDVPSQRATLQAFPGR